MNPDLSETYPDARASVHNDSLTLVEWDPRLRPTVLLPPDPGRDTRFADVRFVGEPGNYEVVVSHDLPHGIDDLARSGLLSWAGEVGITRVWFPDEWVEIGDRLPSIGVARTTCPVCHTEIQASGMAFWRGVRSTGRFPTRCSACGGHLAQCKVEEVA